MINHSKIDCGKIDTYTITPRITYQSYIANKPTKDIEWNKKKQKPIGLKEDRKKKGGKEIKEQMEQIAR